MRRKVSIERFREGRWHAEHDELSVEEPLQVLVNGQPLAMLMRTPGADADLVRGFLFSEGLLREVGDLVELRLEPGQAHVQLAPHCRLSPDMARSMYLSSSCGVCGRAAVAEMIERVEPVEQMDWDGWGGVVEAFEAAQREFPHTGGVHAAALFDASGELLDLAEDVGRHNALDKLVGRAWAGGMLPWRQRVLLMSSRASFDIVQKAAMAGVPVVGTMGAASSLAVELAQATQISLYGFVRRSGMVRFR